MATRTSSLRKATIYQTKFNSKNQPYYESYEVGKQLGKGGFAQVYEVSKTRDTHLGLKAVKIINLKDKHGHVDRSYLEKVQNQIKIMQIASKNTENIVKYYHSFSQSDTTYIIMELCELGSLSDMLKKRKSLSEPEVRYFLLQFIEILVQLKKKGIVHRDIKPANIMVAANFKLKLGDFGLAIFQADIYKAKSLCGTPNYLAPEVILKKNYSYQVDLWAIGVMIYTCLMGFAPFQTKTCNQTYEKIKKCSYRFEGNHRMIKISEDAKSLIRDILKPDSENRIKLEDMCYHPFLCSYEIPRKLEKEYLDSCPQLLFMRKYGLKKVKEQAKETSEGLQVNVQDDSDTVEQRRNSSAPKATYKNCLASKPKEKEVIRMQLRFAKKNDAKEPPIEVDFSNLATSASIKKRDRSPIKQSPPKKIFKNNKKSNNLAQAKTEEPTERKVKLQETPQTVTPQIVSPSLFAPIFAQPDVQILRSNYRVPKNNALAWQRTRNQQNFNNFRQLEDQKLILKSKPATVTWDKLMPNGDFLYKLSNGHFGLLFADGLQAITADFELIKFVNANEQSKQNEESNINHQKRQLVLAYQKEFKVKCEPVDKIELDKFDSLLKAYAYAENAKIYIFSQELFQFKHNNGWSLSLLQAKGYAIYEDAKQTELVQREGNQFHHPNQEICASCKQFVESAGRLLCMMMSPEITVSKPEPKIQAVQETREFKNLVW